MNKTGTRKIETERLILRRFVIEDADDMFNGWCNDPEVSKYLTWPPHGSVEVTKSLLNAWIPEYDKGDYFNWVMELKETGKIIGNISVVRVREDIGEALIGYCMTREYWGNGYMTEALKAFINELVSDGYHEIMIEAMPENIGSNRVIQKAGFELVGTRETPCSVLKPEIVTLNTYILRR